MKEKVYLVTVVLHVYGQKSKAAVARFLEDALHIDGVSVEYTTKPEILDTTTDTTEATPP